jgi:peptidoglycan-associated lipoprotein
MVSLDKLIETLIDNPTVTIEIMSHTDTRNTEEYNQVLSQKRAQSVVDYLVSKGIELERLSAKGYGKSSTKVVDATIAAQYPFLKPGTQLTEQFVNSLPNDEQKESAHQINRRTEFRVLRTDYEPLKK